MLHSVEFLCSVVVALARLARALMSLCSPRSVVAARVPPARAIKKVRPAMAIAVVTALVDDANDQLPAALPPPVLVLPAFKATAKRPSRLVIPPPVARAGVDPFGEACPEAEAEVAAEVEAQGEGFCVASRRGVRHAMEDAYGAITDEIAEDSRLAFYGVYDGHGGRSAVDMIADKLGENIVAALATAPSRQEGGVQLELDVMAAIRAGYLTTDSELLSQGTRGGACAATALVKDGELYVANVGDCRAVLGTRGGVATALTSDHTPGREDERLRIESSGGYVSCRGSSGVWRVQDSLAVSRAFGDADMRPWVTCEPEVTRLRITPDCAILVLASDGLWSKVSNQEAIDVVTRTSGAGVSMDSCKELVAMARSRGSRDDITAMVVDLQRFLR